MRSDIIISVTMSMVIILIFLGLFLIFVSSPALAQLPPELPQVFIDTTFIPPTGSTIFVPAGGDFQAALDSASCGDTISLEAGATFTGNFMLKNKGDCTGNWIVIRSSAGDSNFPPEGERVSPAHASFMPRILTPNAFPAIESESGADHYRLMFIEVGGTSSISINYNLVIFKGSYITADRTIVCGNDNGNFRRGFTLQGRNQAVIDSYVCRIHEAGADSQAIGGWSARGPLKVVNNYLEGAGENLMFGGAKSPTDVVVSDIEIRHNYFFKPLTWWKESPNYAGTPWTVKNLLELKNAQRVLIEGNIFENNWVHAQSGYGILFTPRAHSSTAPWTAVRDITFRLNIVKNSYSGVNILMRDWPDVSQVTVDVEIENNLFILNPLMGGNPNPGANSNRGIVFIGNGPGDYGFKHNTFIMSKDKGMFMLNVEWVNDKAQPKKGVVINDNIVSGSWLGISGSGCGEALWCIDAYLPGSVIKSNVFVGLDAGNYPSGNFFPPDRQDIGFVNFAGGDYRLASTSPYKNAGTDGKDIGADIDAIIAATAGVITGVSTDGGTPSPPPPGDTTPPQISSVAATGISSSSAVITWNTNEIANTQVEYGLTSGYGSFSSLGTSLTTSHSVILSGLQPNTIYHYRVHSADGSGNSAVSSDKIFTTTLIPPPTSDLLAHWKFDDVIGPIATDDSGNGNTGALVNNPTWTAGMIGGALDFDGTNDYVEIPHTTSFLTDDGTVSFWFKTDILATEQGLWSKDSNGFDTGGHLSLSIETDSTIRARLQSSTASFTIFSAPLTANRWYHVVFTFGSGGMKLFIDAGTPSTNSYTGGLGTTSGGSGNFEPIAIGIGAWQSDDFSVTPIRAPFQGIIDDVRIYNRALSASEILLVYNTATDTTPPQISITSPTDNSIVSGVVTINVFASDDTAVSYVEIYKDNLLFVSDSSSPYQAIWNATNELNGLHVLSATAFDAAGNSDSATINVNVNNACFFTKAYWSADSAVEGQTVNLIVEGSNCDGELIDFEIWEQDTLNPDDPVNLSTSSQGWLFISGKATSLWVAEWQCDGRVGIFCTAGNPEYYFNSTLRSDNSTSIKSNLLNVLSAKDVLLQLLENTYLFSKISPGDLAIMRDFDPEIGIKEIQIEVKSEAQNVSLTVTKHDGRPTAVSVKKSGKVYQYLQIEATNLADKLSKATTQFRVEKSWVAGNNLQKEDVAVYGFDESAGQWNELATTYAGEDNDYYYYDTELTSFGYFAISAETSVETGEGETGETTVTETGVAPGEEEERRSLVLQWILIVVGILIITVLMAIGWRIYKYILNMRE